MVQISIFYLVYAAQWYRQDMPGLPTSLKARAIEILSHSSVIVLLISHMSGEIMVGERPFHKKRGLL